MRSLHQALFPQQVSQPCRMVPYRRLLSPTAVQDTLSLLSSSSATLQLVFSLPATTAVFPRLGWQPSVLRASLFPSLPIRLLVLQARPSRSTTTQFKFSFQAEPGLVRRLLAIWAIIAQPRRQDSNWEIRPSAITSILPHRFQG